MAHKSAKDTIAACLVISLGIILTVHLTLFWLYGGVFIFESNIVLLAIESVMSLAISVFGIELLRNAIRGMNDEQAKESN